MRSCLQLLISFLILVLSQGGFAAHLINVGGCNPAYDIRCATFLKIHPLNPSPIRRLPPGPQQAYPQYLRPMTYPQGLVQPPAQYPGPGNPIYTGLQENNGRGYQGGLPAPQPAWYQYFLPRLTDNREHPRRNPHNKAQRPAENLTTEDSEQSESQTTIKPDEVKTNKPGKETDNGTHYESPLPQDVAPADLKDFEKELLHTLAELKTTQKSEENNESSDPQDNSDYEEDWIAVRKELEPSPKPQQDKEESRA